MKMSQVENLENNRYSTDSVIEVITNERAVIEIIDNEDSSDSIIEISDGEDDAGEDSNDCVDLSHVIEAASDDDINDLRIVIKSEDENDEEDAVVIVTNGRSNLRNCTISPSALARGRALKRKHAKNNNAKQNENEFRKRLSTAGSSSLALANAEEQNIETAQESPALAVNTASDSIANTTEDSNAQQTIIKQEENEDGQLPDTSLSMSCSSIKSEDESTLNGETSTPMPAESQPEPRTYDLSKIKWMRPLSNLSSPPHLQIVIIDRSDPNWRITNDKWLMIEKRLLEELHDEMLRQNDGTIGAFDGAKWSKGIKVIGCHNQKSLDFIKKFILSLDRLWIGAKLDVLPITQISRHIVRGYVPPPAMKNDTILSLIKLQNPLIYCEDWQIIRDRERTNAGGGRDIWISISTESFHSLRKSRGEIKYGINRIFLNPAN